jgi:hypothetical protein
MVLTGAIVAFVLGCRPEPIQTYTVRRLDSPIAPSLSPMAASGPAVPARMVAAIAERDDAAWIFKITGDPDLVAATESEWRPFLESLTFGESKVPMWKLPEGWTQSPPEGMRFATLLIGTVDPPVEVAVSKLPPGQDLLGNLNRWRGQLGLELLAADALPSNLVDLAAGDVLLRVFDATGRMPLGSTRPSDADTSAPAENGGSESSAPSSENDELITFDPPTGWERGPASQFTAHRFLKKDGERSAQLAVTRLPSAAQSWTDSVNMWRRELDLEGVEEQQVDEQTEERSIDGRAARLVALQSEGETKRASVIVHVTVGEDGWYFKLTGDADLVAQVRPEFDQLLGSVKFRQAPAAGE